MKGFSMNVWDNKTEYLSASEADSPRTTKLYFSQPYGCLSLNSISVITGTNFRDEDKTVFFPAALRAEGDNASPRYLRQTPGLGAPWHSNSTASSPS